MKENRLEVASGVDRVKLFTDRATKNADNILWKNLSAVGMQM